MKEKIKNFTASMKEAFGGLRITLILTALATLWTVIFMDFENMDSLEMTGFSVWVLYIFAFLVFFVLGSFFTETTFRKRSVIKILSFVVTGLMSAFFTLTLVAKKDFFPVSDGFRNQYLLLYAIAYALIMIFMGVYACYKKSGLKFNEYALGVFMNVFRISIVTGIISTGLMLVSVVALILLEVSDMMILRVELLVFGFFTLPGFLFSLRNAKEEVGLFPKILTSYVTFPIAGIAYLVIYIYLIKILVTWDVPSNSLFAILSVLYFIAIPVFTMTEKANPTAFFQKAIRVLYYAFLPFICMQIYCVGIRIHEYGITPSRYLGILVIFIELIYLLLSLFKAEIRGLIFPVLALTSLFALVLPLTNVHAVSRFSQTGLLRKFEEDPEKADAKKAYGAFEYLLDVPEEITTMLTEKTEEERNELRDLIIEKKDEGGEELIPDGTFWHDLVVDDTAAVNIEGYRTMLQVDGYFYLEQAVQEINAEEYPEELKTAKLNEGSDTEITINLAEILEAYYEEHKNAEEPWEGEERYIKINEHQVLYLNALYTSGEYSEDGRLLFDTVSVSGWLLSK